CGSAARGFPPRPFGVGSPASALRPTHHDLAALRLCRVAPPLTDLLRDFLGGAVGVGEGGLALPVLLGGSADEGQLCGALAEVDAESLPLGSNVVRFTWFDLRQMVGQVGLTDGEFFCLHETAV